VSGKEFAKPNLALTSAAKAKLMSHAWPGNVRELQGVIHRAVAMASGDTLDVHDFDLPESQKPELKGPTMTLLSREGVTEKSSFQDMKARVIEEFERAYLSELLALHHGNISKAARAAKKERRAFQRLLMKHGLDRRVFTAA
jgi:two-component system, NtrC family, response regulator GlrR